MWEWCVCGRIGCFAFSSSCLSGIVVSFMTVECDTFFNHLCNGVYLVQKDTNVNKINQRKITK